MPSGKKSNALRGVAPPNCPTCGKPTTEKDYFLRTRDRRCPRKCKTCQYPEAGKKRALRARKSKAKGGFLDWLMISKALQE